MNKLTGKHMTTIMNNADRATDSARAALDFLVRHQYSDPTPIEDSADNGRYIFTYDCEGKKTLYLSSNWQTGIAIDAMLSGFLFFEDQKYLKSAKRAVEFLWSMQDFTPWKSETCGVFHEVTHQTPMAHPRDALTAAMALFDYSLISDCEESYKRSMAYADWFMRVAMREGYPYWTVRFDDQPWEPFWSGSFHSGSAFFFYRLFNHTGEEKYLVAMETILSHYNLRHIDENGNITVIVDRKTGMPLDGHADSKYTNPGWEMMHRYNDDFGALANLAACQITGKEQYANSAVAFLKKMLEIQRDDGGFGPQNASIPSAAGTVLTELLAAEKLGFKLASQQQYEAILNYIFSRQIRSDDDADGGILGMSSHGYDVSGNEANVRTMAYAISGMIKYAGGNDGVYFISEPADAGQLCLNLQK